MLSQEKSCKEIQGGVPMFAAGTVSNQVRRMAMESEWQSKKNDLGKGRKKEKELTQEEVMLKQFQDEADQIRENRIPMAIDAKIEAGEKLTSEEIEYLKKNNPEALKEYEQIQAEREAYEKKLKNCKSKEEVERLKMTKMGEFLSQAKTIANDPYIPKSQKCGLLKKILKRAAGVEKEHLKFVRSSAYASLPDEEDEEKKKRRQDRDNDIKEENGRETPPLDVFTDENKDALFEIKRMILHNASEVSNTGAPEIGNEVDYQAGDYTVGMGSGNEVDYQSGNYAVGTGSGNEAVNYSVGTGSGSVSGIDAHA